MILAKSAPWSVWKDAARLAAASLLAGVAIAFFGLGILTMEAEGSVFCLISPTAEHCGWCLAGAMAALAAVFVAGAKSEGTQV